MGEKLPTVHLARHGETAWSLSGQHTGLTDLPLTPRGEIHARRLGERLRKIKFVRAFTSPSQRARKTCELAGFGDAAEIVNDLAEWNYGDYEGLRRAEILAQNPDWQLFRDGCPNGESPAQIAARADRVIELVRKIEGDTLIFSSGHLLRVFTARWLAQEIILGNLLLLDTASLSTLGYEHELSRPAISLWNSTCHLQD